MSNLFITLDTDWAPDHAIQESAALLRKYEIPAVWFVTHSSPAVLSLLADPLFEIGIHPNFLDGSTQGKTEKSILRHCLKIVPRSRYLRTHELFQSTGLLNRIYEQTSIQADFSILMPGAAHLSPVRYPNGLIRVPYYFDDSLHMMQKKALWQLRALKLQQPGLKVVNFHPIHIYSNIQKFSDYKKTKHSLYQNRLSSLHRPKKGPGPRDLFIALLKLMHQTRANKPISDFLKHFDP